MSENYNFESGNDVLVNEETDVAESMPGSGLALAALICGIVSMVSLGWCGPTIWASIICGIVGRGKYPSYTSEYKKCKWGMILGIIALVIGVVQGIVLGLFMIFWPVLLLEY